MYTVLLFYLKLTLGVLAIYISNSLGMMGNHSLALTSDFLRNHIGTSDE